MIIQISETGVALKDPTDFGAFHIEIARDPISSGGSAEASSLSEVDFINMKLGTSAELLPPLPDDNHVWVPVDLVRNLAVAALASIEPSNTTPATTAPAATNPTTTEWETGFQAMLSFAKSKGWLDENSSHIQAHIQAHI